MALSDDIELKKEIHCTINHLDIGLYVKVNNLIEFNPHEQPMESNRIQFSLYIYTQNVTMGIIRNAIFSKH